MGAATSADPVLARRAAVVDICQTAANTVIDRVVSEASRAANMFGISRDGAARYGEGIRQTMPLTFESMAVADGSGRDALIAPLAGMARGESAQSHSPHMAQGCPKSVPV